MYLIGCVGKTWTSFVFCLTSLNRINISHNWSNNFEIHFWLLCHHYCPSNYFSPLNSSDLKAPLVASFSSLMFLTAGLKLTISYLSSATQRPDSREASTQS